MSGQLYLVATPIGNLGDMSIRALEILKEVDLIAAEDTRHTLGLLNHFNIQKPLTSYHEHNKREKGEILIDKLKNGENIALVSDAGTPAISDPGEDLVSLCVQNGIKVVPVPGAVAGINALIASSITTKRFCFEGFLSVNKKSRREHLLELKDEKRTMIFYEAPHKLKTTLSDLYSFFGNRKITLARELTKKFEEFIYTDLEGAIKKYEDSSPKGEYVLVLEGAAPKEDEAEDFSNLSPKEHVLMYEKEGLVHKDALKKAASDRGMTKSELYRLLHKD